MEAGAGRWGVIPWSSKGRRSSYPLPASPSPEQPASRRPSNALFLLYTHCHSWTKDTPRSQILGDIQNQGLVHNQDVGAGGSNK